MSSQQISEQTKIENFAPQKGNLQIPNCVEKRNGEKEKISFDKILWRIEQLSVDLNVNPIELAQEVIAGLYDGIKTSDIDRLSAEIAHQKITIHPDWDNLAARIAVSNHHKETMEPFSTVMWQLHQHGTLNDEYYEMVEKNAALLDDTCDYSRDYTQTYHGFKTFEKSYGLRIKEKTKDQNICEDDNGIVYERWQHTLMRTAVWIHLNNIHKAIETYHMMSKKKFIHATPTLFNSGTRTPQGSSCFLVAMKEEEDDEHGDSISKIYDTLKNVALISKSAGGIGLSVSNVRARGSPIGSTGRGSMGIVPMLKNFEQTARYVDQGRKRKGAIACFCQNTEIVTINNGVKKIQEIKVGDLVVTHKNRIKPVSQLHINPLGDRKIYKLVVERNKEVYVTGNHRFWSFYTKKYKNEKLSLGWNNIEQLKKIMDNPETKRQTCYIAIPSGTGINNSISHKIDVFDYKDILEDEDHKLRTLDSNNVMRLTLSLKKNGKNNISHSQSVHRIWNITTDLANLFGIWLGDGCIIKDNVRGIVRGIGITVDKSNKKEIDFIKMVYRKTFGTNVTTDISKTSNCVTIRVNSGIVGMIFHELFGSYFNRKCLPDIIFSWPKILVESLIGGLVTSDGHIAKIKCNATLQLSNKTLINQLYHLGRINNIAISFVKYKRGKGMTCEPYSMSIPLNKNILNQTRKFYTDDRIERCHAKIDANKNMNKNFLKIHDIIETDRKDEYVYTLGVEDDHSYTVEGLLAENCYLEPWHADIFEFLELKKNTGAEELRARDLHLALWIPDLFMKRVKEDGKWSLMCPYFAPELYKTHGKEFEEHYERYEREGQFKRQVKARELWCKILEAQIENGEPYMLYKDQCNAKSNQQNLGTIRSSNLCAEIILYSDNNESAVCNLASIALPSYIDILEDGTNNYNFDELAKAVRIVTLNLNNVIDRNFYPTPETKRSNFRHRPIGMGVQGLANTFIEMRYPFDSEEAKQLNKEIFETMYYAALSASCKLAKKYGPYETFAGSPASKGVLQFDMWDDVTVTDRWNWIKLRNNIKKYGLRNSVLLSLMPTASTSQLLGFNECFEPFTSNMYARNTSAGTYKVVNKEMVLDLIKLGLWSEKMKNRILVEDGSIQNIPEIPQYLKDLYKTAWDLSQRVLIDLAADRAPFICQTQSSNYWMKYPDDNSLTSLHFYAWEKGLKTGIYYLRTSAALEAQQVTIDPASVSTNTETEERKVEQIIPEEGMVCYKEEGCVSCGS